MPILELETFVAAPAERCFDLALSVDAHLEAAAATGERVVGGLRSGVMGLGDEVTWRARHLGRVREMSVRITAHDRPRHFRDEMQRGAFRYFRHDHHFEAVEGGTRVSDHLDFQAPFGLLGRLAECLVLERHLRRFLEGRNRALKAMAETEAWRRYLPER